MATIKRPANKRAAATKPAHRAPTKISSAKKQLPAAAKVAARKKVAALVKLVTPRARLVKRAAAPVAGRVGRRAIFIDFENTSNEDELFNVLDAAAAVGVTYWCGSSFPMAARDRLATMAGT